MVRRVVTPQEGDLWCSFDRPYIPRSYGRHDVWSATTYVLIKKTFNDRISHGWKCFVTTCKGEYKVEIVDVRAVESWFSSDKYIQYEAETT